MRVAIIGAGPSGLYAAGNLLENGEHAIEVDLIERLPTPWGLIRTGVAPDHGEKKQITDRLFDFTLRHERLQFFGNIAVGRDVKVSELAEWYDAVIYAHGAGGHNRIGIAGEDLSGVHGAREFVQFYNAHPDQAHQQFDLSHPRVLIVGNGNVAVDIARILTTDVSELAKTDIADQALEALRNSKVREVVIMGRRDLEFAAFNNPELEEFGHLDGVDIAVKGGLEPPSAGTGGLATWRAKRRYELMRGLVSRPATPGNKRVVFHFLTTPLALHGKGRVERLDYVNNQVDRRDGLVRYERGSAVETMDAGLVLSACGYRGTPLDGLPFDDAAGVIPNKGGRVMAGGYPQSGTYVTGWIKRGCRGIIGSNRRCANETVVSLLADHNAGLLRPATLTRDEARAMMASRSPHVVMFDNWRSIDRAERIKGRTSGRPRVKLASVDALLDAAFAEPIAEIGAY
jgi:NADPH-dependent glutamate synthase beta subunit-like oxidoreductase